MTPANLTTLRQSRKAFIEWLVALGAEIIEPTNEWEVLRFRADGVTSIVYRNKAGTLRFTGVSGDAWTAFKTAAVWRACAKTTRKGLSPKVKTLLARDGDSCFYCHFPTTDEDRTAEHLVSVTHGGPNHLSNLVLAHRSCNAEAGHLSAMEKIHMRERNREALDEI